MNIGYENFRYYTPYQVFNPYQFNSRNNFILDVSKDSNKYPFSQIGYQIMNPQMISYHLEPIYSLVSSKIKKKGSSILLQRKDNICRYSPYSHNRNIQNSL